MGPHRVVRFFPSYFSNQLPGFCELTEVSICLSRDRGREVWLHGPNRSQLKLEFERGYLVLFSQSFFGGLPFHTVRGARLMVTTSVVVDYCVYDFPPEMLGAMVGLESPELHGEFWQLLELWESMETGQQRICPSVRSLVYDRTPESKAREESLQRFASTRGPKVSSGAIWEDGRFG